MEPRSGLTPARGCGLLALGGALLVGALGAAVVYGQLHLDVGPGKFRFYVGTPPPDWHTRALLAPGAPPTPAAPVPLGAPPPTAGTPVPAAQGPHVPYPADLDFITLARAVEADAARWAPSALAASGGPKSVPLVYSADAELTPEGRLRVDDEFAADLDLFVTDASDGWWSLHYASTQGGMARRDVRRHGDDPLVAPLGACSAVALWREAVAAGLAPARGGHLSYRHGWRAAHRDEATWQIGVAGRGAVRVDFSAVTCARVGDVERRGESPGLVGLVPGTLGQSPLDARDLAEWVGVFRDALRASVDAGDVYGVAKGARVELASVETEVDARGLLARLRQGSAVPTKLEVTFLVEQSAGGWRPTKYRFENFVPMAAGWAGAPVSHPPPAAVPPCSSKALATQARAAGVAPKDGMLLIDGAWRDGAFVWRVSTPGGSTKHEVEASKCPAP